MSDTAQASSDLISTAEAAKILGFSRPYVAMFSEQHKIRGATVSSGGHRRVPCAFALEWARRNQESKMLSEGSSALRADSNAAGVYKSSEAVVVRRMKVLARD